MKSVCLSVFLLLAVPAAYPQSGSETFASGNPSIELRVLAQRAARQYMMYQYGVGDLAITKEPLLETVERFSANLKGLQASAGAAASPEIESQLKVVEGKWDKLEKIFTYQPYKLFQAKELLPPAVRKQDPVLVRYVDRLTQELVAECELLIDAYARHCEAAGSDACPPQLRDIGTQMLLVEAVTTNLLFTVLDIDRSERRTQLSEKVQQLQSSLDRAGSPGHFGANPSVLIEPVLETISAYWKQMSASVDLALEGDEEEVNIRQMLRSQRRLLEEIDNLTSIVSGR